MSECADLTYYQRNRDVILNRAKDYYENDKERLREQARDKYRNLSEEEKNKKREYGRNRYCNIPKKKIKRENMGGIDTTICLKKRNKDQKIKEYQKIIAKPKRPNILINK